jgi:SAM-dependent methyltransferase
MSNNDPLTAEEYEAYRPTSEMVERIEACRRTFFVPRREFRVVDWGCGRGALVLWLRQRGFDAVGVDVDPRPFRQGVDLFRSLGQRPEDCLHALDPTGRAPFPDASFHFVTSWQTIEHVADLDAAAAEWRRLTRAGGRGFHVYPPHRRLLEPHLFMPLIHWLPKTRTREALIGLFVLLGVEPHWWPKGELSLREKVRTYHRFSVNDTFYRTRGAVRACLAARGFDVEFVDTKADRPLRRAARRWLGPTPSSRPVWRWLDDLGDDLALAVTLPRDGVPHPRSRRDEAAARP